MMLQCRELWPRGECWRQPRKWLLGAMIGGNVVNDALHFEASTYLCRMLEKAGPRSARGDAAPSVYNDQKDIDRLLNVLA